MRYTWTNLKAIPPKQFVCGYCANLVGPNQGWSGEADTKGPPRGYVYICTFCTKPTFIAGDTQSPGAAFGSPVDHLEKELDALYSEARSCMSVNAFTSAVLACRKILMHVAVDLGAKQGQSFLNYVGFLQKNNHIPPGSKIWVDHIREKGNEANHEIRLSSKEEAELLISFVEMLLRITYEFPRKVPGPIASDILGDP